MAAGTPYSAHQAVLRVGTTVVLYGTEWDVDPNSAMLEVSNFEGNGFRDFIRGLRQITLTARGWWDGGANMHEGTLGVIDGATLANVRAHTSGTSSPFWSLPSAIVERCRCTARVDDLLRYDATFHGKGAFVAPTGNVA